jgi:hypothetical protein
MTFVAGYTTHAPGSKTGGDTLCSPGSTKSHPHLLPQSHDAFVLTVHVPTPIVTLDDLLVPGITLVAAEHEPKDALTECCVRLLLMNA